MIVSEIFIKRNDGKRFELSNIKIKTVNIEEILSDFLKYRPDFKDEIIEATVEVRVRFYDR